MKLVVMSAGEFTIKLVKKLHALSEIELVGVIPDNSIDKEYLQTFKREVERLGVLVGSECLLKLADMVLVIEYRKLINKSIVDKYNIINVHAGILPKYKGFSSNAFAIMNGEKQIGYTIHQMDDSMDGGDIFYVQQIDILENETYCDVHDKLLENMLETIPTVLLKIWKKQILPKPQVGKSIYGCKFKPEYGLVDFRKSTNWIYNLYRCMAKPLGTGVYFLYNNQRYDVAKMKKTNEVDNYLGIEGIIVNIVNGELWVKTQDNVIVLCDVTPKKNWKIGMQLGL